MFMIVLVAMVVVTKRKAAMSMPTQAMTIPAMLAAAMTTRPEP